jgi:DNA processing protein
LDSIRPWFYLKSVPGVGNLLCKRLIEHFKSPQNVIQASEQELLQVSGLTRRHVMAIKNHKLPVGVDAELNLIERKNYRIVTLTEPGYPRLLREIPDPPPILYVHGRLEGDAANLAVVGSRHATRYGLTATESLCESLTAYNLTIVSGMARGIDTAAHEGALAAGGQTIAVLGSGLERIYPAGKPETISPDCRKWRRCLGISTDGQTRSPSFSDSQSRDQRHVTGNRGGGSNQEERIAHHRTAGC